MDTITLLAPAKINLTLEIVGLMPNGYHLLEMVMQSISLFDEVTVTKNTSEIITITSDNKTIPTDHTNIAHKTATAFFENTNIKGGADIFIEKNIPSQAGLGGGSADGAAVLIALNTIYKTNLSKQQLAQIGQAVGADIPFCIYGNTAFVGGFGEQVRPIRQMADCFIVVAKPPVGVDTRFAYEKADEQKNMTIIDSKLMLDAIDDCDICKIADNIFNRFEQVINKSEIANLKQGMLDLGALNSAMTGSGSAVFAIFNDHQKASECTKVLKLNFKDTDVFLCTPYFIE